MSLPTNPVPTGDIRDKLIIGLDVPSVEEARAVVDAHRRCRHLLQDRLPAGLCGRLRIRPRADRPGQEGLPRPQAPRHRQHRRGGRALGGAARRHLPHRPRLSADHARGGGRESRLGPEDPRRDGADVLRRQRPRRGGLCAGSGGRARRPPRRTGARSRHRRHRLRRDGSGARARHPRAGPPDRHPRHPPGGRGCRRPEAHRHASGRHPSRRQPSRGRPGPS